MDTAITLDIDQRTGLPEELYVLHKSHPRASWQTARSALAQFWIDKHNYLKRQSAALLDANKDYREQRIDASQFGTLIAPRLQGFLSELHGHHQIEDFHYFPAFRIAEPRLNPGFDVLASDHEKLHAGILDIVDAVNGLISTLRDESSVDTDAQRRSADRYIAAGELMHQRLGRHLEDEEDLIIPVMLIQGH
jgi:hemerythrin-like domain-containing protein